MMVLRSPRAIASEEGFVLMVSMVMLLTLTLLGIWSLNTGTFEIQISGNEQEYRKRFNIAEGGANLEATSVGFFGRDEYNIDNPDVMDKYLLPVNFEVPPDVKEEDYFEDTKNWPEGIELVPGDQDSKYNYLVKYLYPDVPPKGYDASMFSSYKFRIDGARTVVIELGGIKVGVKASM